MGCIELMRGFIGFVQGLFLKPKPGAWSLEFAVGTRKSQQIIGFRVCGYIVR